VVEKVLDCREVKVEVTDDAAGSDKQEEQERVRDDEGVAHEPTPSPEELKGQLAEARAARALPTDSRVPGGAPSGKGWFPWVRCRYVFNRIAQDEYADWFADPVDTSFYTDYLNIVERGVCLAEVRAELEKEEPYGNDVALFAADIRLIWKNCEKYNLVQSAVYQAGEMFSRIFERLMTGWVMNFKSGLHKWEDAPSRPWETFCLVCMSRRPDKELELVACDFCEGQYHIGCLEPPLVDVPAGPWLCQGCEQIEREGAIGHHSHLLEEALREKVARQCRTTTLKKQKMYLVKWKDLGYASCTWEKPEDLQDNAKIAEYHKLNDAPPQEPVVPQEALLQQLATRQDKFNPALKDSGDLTELEFQAYAQMSPPGAVLRDCGVLPHAYSFLGQPSGLTEGPAPEKEEEARAGVAVLLSEMVDHCARGQLPPPLGLPPTCIEYDVTFYRPPGDTLSLNVGNYRGRVTVQGFRPRGGGGRGALERSARVSENDVLVAINGEWVLREPFQKVIDKLQATSGYVTLRFVAKEWRDHYLDKHEATAPVEHVEPAAAPSSSSSTPSAGSSGKAASATENVSGESV
jgi:hypothetical protein